MFPIFAGNSAATGYNLTRSLRFRASASAYLDRTPASAGNRKTWTWSAWVKRGTLATADYPTLFSAATDSSNFSALSFYDISTGYLQFNYVVGGVDTTRIATTQVFRDPSAWYHIVLTVDTTQATAANRMKLYVNGSQITAFSYASYPSQNTDMWVNATIPHGIGITRGVGGRYYDGYLTEVNFIDGQALTPSSFGSTNTLTGVWQPARYTGTYGTNGFYLPFTDNSALTTSSNVGLGKDFSGNGNYWTTNNISITAGVTYDSMTDVPTLTSATAANFAVLNPLDKGTVTVDNANLRVVYSANTSQYVRGTIGATSGKWYFETTIANGGSGTAASIVGIATSAVSITTAPFGNSVYQWGYLYTGNKINNSTSSAYGASFTNGDVIGIAYDLDNLTLTFYKNGTSQGTAFTGLPSGQVYFPAVSTNDATINTNFGQRPFSYTPPTGYVALNTYNLPTSTIVKGNTVMDATTYTGTLLSNAVANAAAFKPDLVWVKSRSAATDNKLTDSARGVTKGLISNTTGAETTDTQGLTAFNTNGFTVGANTDYNNLTGLYVAWQWQAGQGSTSSNTSGSITSTVSVNASAGFSVVTYTGNGTNPGATIGHGLGVAPSLIITKSRSGSGEWPSYHVSVGITNTLYLNATYASSTYLNRFSAVSSSTFTTGSNGSELNTNGVTYVAYCWTPIAGYSSFGSYTGNGSADGVFVYTGFRPKFVMFKRTDTTGDWLIEDTARSTYNLIDARLFPYLPDAEVSNGNGNIDYLSNGFKLRNSAASMNASGGAYIYMAFAENPFKNSLAR